MAFFNQPVSGECCPDPCTRSGPCDPCECPETICCDDERSWGTIDFSGTYNENGTYGGSIAYERADSGAWFWRNWADYPTEGWWTISVAKGYHGVDSVTQSETQAGGDACPTSQTSMWEPYALDGGSVVPGVCTTTTTTTTTLGP